MSETISVCIATYRRPERLAALVRDLALLTLRPHQVVVVDNDTNESARQVVDALAAELPFAMRYAVQPERNIARTRNMTVELATGDWLAFLDDDERVPADWLHTMRQAAERFSADGVLGPVTPQLPETAAGWIRRGRFYEFPRMNTGDTMALNLMRFGNVLLRGEPVRALEGPFDVNYSLTTGEDGDMLLRMVEAGAHIVWCDDAEVFEPVEAGRLRLRWILQRALSGGQEYARKHLRGRYGHRGTSSKIRLLASSVVKCTTAVIMTVVALPFGRHHSAFWLARFAANAGKLSVFLGWKYQEYSNPSNYSD